MRCVVFFWSSFYQKWQIWKNIHVCIKFYLKLGKTATITYEMLKLPFREETVSRIHIYEYDWVFKLKSRVTLVNSAKHLEYLSMTRMDHQHSSTTVIGYNSHVQSRELLLMFLTLAQSLDSLHQVTWELLWTGQHGVITEKKIQKLLGHTTYHENNNKKDTFIIYKLL